MAMAVLTLDDDKNIPTRIDLFQTIDESIGFMKRSVDQAILRQCGHLNGWTVFEYVAKYGGRSPYTHVIMASVDENGYIRPSLLLQSSDIDRHFLTGFPYASRCVKQRMLPISNISDVCCLVIAYHPISNEPWFAIGCSSRQTADWLQRHLCIRFFEPHSLCRFFENQLSSTLKASIMAQRFPANGLNAKDTYVLDYVQRLCHLPSLCFEPTPIDYILCVLHTHPLFL